MAPELAVLTLVLAAGLGQAQQAQEASADQWTPVATSAKAESNRLLYPQQPEGRPKPPEERLPVFPSLEGPFRIGEGILPVASTESDVGGEYQSRITPPSIQQLAETVQNDAQLQERIRQEERDRGLVGNLSEFPPDPVLSTDRYMGRNWPAMQMQVAPYYLAHGRLLFQQINAERYGWDLGFIHPIVAAATFFGDFVLLPYNLGTALCRPYEGNLGWCLPGDPAPLALYPPELTLTGTMAEVATILGLVAIFP